MVSRLYLLDNGDNFYLFFHLKKHFQHFWKVIQPFINVEKTQAASERQDSLSHLLKGLCGFIAVEEEGHCNHWHPLKENAHKLWVLGLASETQMCVQRLWETWWHPRAHAVLSIHSTCALCIITQRGIVSETVTHLIRQCPCMYNNLFSHSQKWNAFKGVCHETDRFIKNNFGLSMTSHTNHRYFGSHQLVCVHCMLLWLLDNIKLSVQTVTLTFLHNYFLNLLSLIYYQM